MTQEEKQLLLKDLCARLPYNFVYLYTNAPFADNKPIILTPVVISNLMNATEDLILKPYLRPMSSMTEEESKEMCKTVCSYDKITSLQIISDRVRYGILYNGSFNQVTLFFNKIYSLKQVDWLNAHHFDYRGLIPMGLGIDCTGLNIYENEKSI